MLLYGVDFMSSDDIKKYFKVYGEVEISWLDDSQALIKFDKDETAKRAHKEIRLTEARQDNKLPSLEEYLKILAEEEKEA